MHLIKQQAVKIMTIYILLCFICIFKRNMIHVASVYCQSAELSISNFNLLV